MLTPSQVAEELALSRTVVYRMIRRGELDACEPVKGRLRVDRADVDALKERTRVKPAPRHESPMYEPPAPRAATTGAGSFRGRLEAIRGGRADVA